ncbi:MAG: hypothetical protein QME94_07410 [Anaerolineae bacterium]|nr:hypothetical protein [Anaerolineae bacterium]
MGVRFRWYSGDSSEGIRLDPEPPPPRRRRRRWLIALLLALLAVAGALYWRAERGLSAARAALQAQVDQEVMALQSGSLDALCDLLDSRYAPWLRYHYDSFAREAAWYAARPGLRVLVEAVELAPDHAVARVRLWDGTGRTDLVSHWHFRRLSGQWRHAPPTLEAWGAPTTLETEHLALVAQGPDRALAAQLAPELDAFCADLLRTYGAAGSATGKDVRITIRILPYGSSCDGGSTVPSPHLAFDLWSAGERGAALGRSARLAIARAVLSRLLGRSRPGPGDWWLVESLASWHAQVWQPEWRASLRHSLADGTYRQYLGLEVYGITGQGRVLRSMPVDMDWARPLAYAMGEFLAVSYPREQLGALLRALASSGSSWAALESVLDLTRPTLEAAWLKHLQQRYGA